MLKLGILRSCYWISICVAIAFYVSIGNAATIIIDQDTVIDAGNSYPDDHTRIIDGPGQPTHVNLASGGEVRGFTVAGNSVFEINGGKSTFLSGTQDNATLVMKGGSIGCTSFPVCMVIDYDALVHITDQSTLHVFGGSIHGAISLTDSATAHFYGRNLRLLSDDRGAFVEGELANGDSGYFGIGVVPSSEVSKRVFLHEIPEPISLQIFILSLAITVPLQRRIEILQYVVGESF